MLINKFTYSLYVAIRHEVNSLGLGLGLGLVLVLVSNGFGADRAARRGTGPARPVPVVAARRFVEIGRDAATGISVLADQ